MTDTEAADRARSVATELSAEDRRILLDLGWIAQDHYQSGPASIASRASARLCALVEENAVLKEKAIHLREVDEQNSRLKVEMQEARAELAALKAEREEKP